MSEQTKMPKTHHQVHDVLSGLGVGGYYEDEEAAVKLCAALNARQPAGRFEVRPVDVRAFHITHIGTVDDMIEELGKRATHKREQARLPFLTRRRVERLLGEAEGLDSALRLLERWRVAPATGEEHTSRDPAPSAPAPTPAEA